MKILDELNSIIYPDGRERLEYGMFGSVIEKKERELQKLKKRNASLKKDNNRMRDSISWKIGRMATYLPRNAKSFFRQK